MRPNWTSLITTTICVATAAACVSRASSDVSDESNGSVQRAASDTHVVASSATLAKSDYTRSEVLAARQQYKIRVQAFDASQQYGTEFPYSDRVTLSISNESQKQLQCLTVLL